MSAIKTGEHVNMKKIVLSTLVALSIATVASATDVKLYQDANGQVFTSAADGRTEISTNQGVSVNSMTDRLDFSMLAYLGFVNTDYRNAPTAANKVKPDTSDFEARRMYFQVKAYLDGSKKDYFRVTYDVYSPSQVSYSGSATTTSNYYATMVKYAYLYLDKILPFTDVEIGQAHTTLLDYEESHSWAYRSFDNVFTEQPNGPGLNASAGRGIDLKTNTKYFSSEIGVYNNSGYHDPEGTTNNNGMGMDYEARLTAHVLGTGTDYNSKHTYFDVSLLGKHNVNATTGITNTANGANIDYIGVHSVFNTENFLIAGQYISAPDTTSGADVSAKAGQGYSVNFDARAGEKDQYHVFGRVDRWTAKLPASSTLSTADKRTYIGGAAWDMNKNVQWQASVITTDNQNDKNPTAGKNINLANGNQYMLTAQVSF